MTQGVLKEGPMECFSETSGAWLDVRAFHGRGGAVLLFDRDVLAGQARVVLRTTALVVYTLPDEPSRPHDDDSAPYAQPRTVAIHKSALAPLGLSIKVRRGAVVLPPPRGGPNTDPGMQGGKDMGMPVVISALVDGGAMAATRQFYVGDEIVAVNGQPLADARHTDAVALLRQATLGVRGH